MHAHADPIPCHHSKWPRRCPKCEIPALGFNVYVPISRKWNESIGEVEEIVWKSGGMFCEKCFRAIIPRIEDGAPVSEEYIRALVKADMCVFRVLEVNFVSVDLFRTFCCLPAEEAEKVGEEA